MTAPVDPPIATEAPERVVAAASGGPVIDLRPTPPPVGLGERPAASLSPSRAGDFLTCPLMYRFRTIDRLPEPPSTAAARGTVVHAVLERLFDHPAPHRTAQTAVQLLPAAWDAVVAQEPHLPGLLFGGPDAWDRWLATQETAPSIRLPWPAS